MSWGGGRHELPGSPSSLTPLSTSPPPPSPPQIAYCKSSLTIKTMLPCMDSVYTRVSSTCSDSCRVNSNSDSCRVNSNSDSCRVNSNSDSCRVNSNSDSCRVNSNRAVLTRVFLRNFACKPSRKFSSGQYYVKCKNVRGRQSKGQYIIILGM